MDDEEEARLFRWLHIWHEDIPDRPPTLEVKLRVEEIKHELLDLREQLRELRKK